MTVGLRTSWLQYPVETITSPRCVKYGIPYRTPKYTSQNSSLSRNYLQITWRIFTIIRLISEIKKQTSPKIESPTLSCCSCIDEQNYEKVSDSCILSIFSLGL